MSRLIINNQKRSNISKLNIEDNSILKNAISIANPNKLLRKRRSVKYVETLNKLDSGDICLNNSLKDEFIEKIKNEFKEIKLDMWPKGIVAKCYLGDDYEVHTLDINKKIVRHYKINEAMPTELEKARNISVNKNYAFVEVYSNMLRIISLNGDVSEINI